MTSPKDTQPSSPTIWRLSEVRSKRSFIFLAIGAAVGLGIAGFGLFTAKGTSTHTVPAEDVALVNQQPILTVDFETQLQTLYGVSVSAATKEQKRKVLNDMIREELFVQRGLELGMPSSDPDTRTALVAAVEQQVSADVAASEPKEDDLRKYYQEHQAKYSNDGMMTVQDLVLAPAPGVDARDAMKRAAAAVDSLRRGAAPAAVQAQFGLADSHKTNGEEFYFAVQIHLGDALYQAALPLKDRQVSDPIQTGAEIHILVMNKNKAPTPLSFEQARDQLLTDYRRDREARLQEQDDQYLRGKAEILVAPEFQ